VPRHVRAHPGGALLDAAKDAQLIVVGRSTGAHHRGGFHIGSTTRSILHYTPCPVMVVPEHVG
jgi:nucleotide-binding universal stress UspA family protein